MSKFLSLLSANVNHGESALIQQTLDAFVKKQQTGWAEFEWENAPTVIILFSEGQMVGANIQEDSAYKKIPIEQLSQHWQPGKVHVYCVQARQEMVRTALAALEWHLPSTPLAIQGDTIQNHLEQAQALKQNGLFHFSWGDGDGYVLILNGLLRVSESLLVSAKGSLSGDQAFNELLAQPTRPITLEFYEADTASITYQQTSLRAAFTQLLPGILNRYSRLVGAGMTESLAVMLNQQMEAHQIHLRLDHNQLRDTHIFVGMGMMIKVYRFLLKNLLEQMSEMIGNGLAHSMTFEVFKTLSTEDQQCLRESPLMVMIISTR
jgi:hypothetical protein